MDLEELVKLLKLENAGEILSNSDYKNYLVQLSSCGIEKLSREEIHLNDERESILDQTQSLVYENYKTFIHTADCTRDVYKQFGDVEKHLGSLQTELPVLKKGIESFLASSKNLSASRQAISLTLAKHTELLEILELPQLMETCVRNGYYDDALDILAYAHRLEKKHSDIPVILSIIDEVKSVSRLMLTQLFNQLRSQITLPQCLKVVGILRRLDVFNEVELRLKFLQARDAWFTTMIKNIPKEDAYHHVTKVVELSRVHLFDIVTQYRAIFSDDEMRYANNDVNEASIFHGWILHKVNQFLNILEIDLNRGVSGSIESLLSQCMFFGQSFSRVGADFRPLLIPVFEKAVYSQFEADVRSANLKFDEKLCMFSLMDANQVRSSSFFNVTQQQEKTSPPLGLMEFSPLAYYTNGIMASFNGLRQCCPLSLCGKVVALLEKSLVKVVNALAELHHLESAGFTETEEAAFKRMADLLCNALIPHINACLQMLFPLQSISNVTGMSTKELKQQNFVMLLVDEISVPLKNFLPDKNMKNEFENSVSEDVKSETSLLHSVPEEEPLVDLDEFVHQKDSIEQTVENGPKKHVVFE